MNVSSASLAPASLFAKDPASPNATAAPQKSPLASLLDKSSPSSISQGSGHGKDSAPGLDVAKKLKALGEQFLAVMLITDPVERARAAKDLYKQYAQTAKEYADATSDGRAAAEAATQAFATDPNAALNPNAQDAQAAGSATDEAASVATDDGVPPPAAPAGDPADTANPATGEPAQTTSSAPTAQPVIYMPGKKSNFVADLYMEQIKTFASAAQQVYQSAVEEARNKHRDKTKMHGFDDEMKAAKEDLTKAAKAVEGPAATADGYDPTAAALPSSAPSAPSVLNLTV